MESKSLVIRTKNRLSHFLLPNAVCDEINCDENYGIRDVLKDCVKLSFIAIFILTVKTSNFFCIDGKYYSDCFANRLSAS